jgi:hypothetical protein
MHEHSLLTVHLHIQLAVPSGYNISTHNSNLHTGKKKKKRVPFVSSEFAHAIEIYVSQSHAAFCLGIIILSWESLHFALRQLAEKLAHYILDTPESGCSLHNCIHLWGY